MPMDRSQTTQQLERNVAVRRAALRGEPRVAGWWGKEAVTFMRAKL
jgi:hypothetical protein